ncbi:winged helix-turn-helix domain-containing protein [Streptomyces sp. 7-21]|uniref:AfsR/SARP family transcriptional regulator n=1 Tax=Streptomyces sp. 7-21 TaxID=2802283 RepID=UPI001F02ED82|nr:winged helix-turn-helix domain-containing protein [Streptomyces sp. 7-21]
MAAEFEYRLLGQVGIWRGDEPLATLTTQQRTILAALLLEPGQDVSMDRFVPMLWTGEPPRSARNVIQVAVSRLRKALPREAQDTLRTTASGYRFTGDPQRVDLHRFRSLTERAARTSGEEASTLYREAIGLWHGPALAGTAPTELCGSLASKRWCGEDDAGGAGGACRAGALPRRAALRRSPGRRPGPGRP